MLLENWLDSIVTNSSKVMWVKFGSKRNISSHGWCIAKSMILVFWLDFVTWWLLGEKRKSWFWKTGWTQSSQLPPKWCGRSLGAKEIDLGMVGA